MPGSISEKLFINKPIFWVYALGRNPRFIFTGFHTLCTIANYRSRSLVNFGGENWTRASRQFDDSLLHFQRTLLLTPIYLNTLAFTRVLPIMTDASATVRVDHSMNEL